MKKLMIMGGGIYQLPLILKAKAMGIHTIAVSIPGPYPGLQAADEVLPLDTKDTEAVLAAAKDLEIDGITTSGTDVAVPTIGAVNDALGLHGISWRAARILSDKARMKEAFSGTVTTSPFRIVSSLDALREAAEDIGYPLMVKACDVSGSRGITKVDTEEGLQDAFETAFAATRRSYILAEGFVRGTEFGLDALITDGTPALCLPHKKFLLHTGRTDVPAGHIFPMALSPKAEAALLRELAAITEASGLRDGALNADMMLLPDDSVSVIEAGGRAGATCIPELIERSSGVDYYAQIIRSALGLPTDFTVTKKEPCMAQLLFASGDGQVRSIRWDLLDALRAEGLDISLDVRPGDRVRLPQNGTDRIGHVIGSGFTEAVFSALAAEAQAAVEISAAYTDHT